MPLLPTLRHAPRLLGGSSLRVRHTEIAFSTRPRIPLEQKLLGASQTRNVIVAGQKQYKSGHIETVSNEGIFFFDNVFPLHLQWLLRLPWRAETVTPEIIKRFQRPALTPIDPIQKVERVSNDGLPFEITEILPRFKEGGAFVKFKHADDVSAEEVEASLRKHLKEKRIKPWWNPFRRARARLVLGRPWIEDLHRLPSARLKVEFLPSEPGTEPAELSQEQLYSFFRPYGKLSEISPQPPDSKVLPKFAHLDFSLMRRAIMAKNCMHGYRVPLSEGGGKNGTVLRLTYVPKIRLKWVKDWLFSHPRIVIPLLAAIIAAITVVVFDPIRTWFIKAHITRAFHVEDSKAWRWFKSQATDLLRMRPHDDDDSGMGAIWDDRKDNIEQIRNWLMETADTFIVVQGPRGSEKRKLVVDQALKDRKKKLIIDCKPIQDARGDSATIRAAATEVGYRPVFSWMNSLSSYLDMAAQGATGVKTGFSETLDGQLSKILNNTAAALKQVAVEDRKKDDKDAQLTTDEYLDAHPEKRPVVVIDNFLHKSQETDMVYDKIAEWAARLTTANLAHVIFLTSETSYSKTLSKALPDRVVRTLSLTDCSPEVAKRYVLDQLNADAEDTKEREPQTTQRLLSKHRTDLDELDECIAALGGRLTDLEFLTRRIKAGETPKKAVREIIEQSASEVLKMYLSSPDSASSSSTSPSQRKWTPEQAWALIKRLGTTSPLRYNEVLLDSAFPSDAAAGDAVLQALESAELIAIASAHGRPHSIRPGKPVLQPAFRALVEDRVLRSRMELASLARRTKAETDAIEKVEAELRALAELPKQPAELAARTAWLLKKVQASQAKIEGWERESAGWKRVLQEEY